MLCVVCWLLWSACQSYAHAMLQCAVSNKIQKVDVDYDARVAIWFALGCAGLRARFVGGSRVRMIRRSPGCGVNRRKVHTVRCDRGCGKCLQAGCVSCFPRCQQVSCEPSCSVDLVECGSRWYGWKAKCLQACVASLFRGDRRLRVERYLRTRCSNDAGSGCSGSREERRNLEAVQQLLVEQHMYIDVFEASCAGSLVSGSIVGVWQLGAVSGMCAGSVAWLTDSCHVVKLRGAESCAREFTPLTTTIPPWERVVVGSPKSKRGANFKKGGSGYASR